MSLNSNKIRKFNEMVGDTNLEVYDSMTRVWLSDKTFKKIHIKNLGEILYKVYKPMNKWKKKGDKGYYGVMGLDWDDEEWSILNRINTNYTALSIMINSINNVLDRGNSEIKRFDFITPKFGSVEFYAEYDRFMEFVKRNARNIFLKTTEENGSTVINNIVNAIRRSKGIGDDAEKIVVEYLPKLFGGVSNIKLPDGSGDANDMVGGADIFFDYNGETNTIQVKKIRSLNKYISKYKPYGKDVYYTKGASISKPYLTNYYAILDSENLYFFKNDTSRISIKNGELGIPADLLLKEFRYK